MHVDRAYARGISAYECEWGAWNELGGADGGAMSAYMQGGMKVGSGGFMEGPDPDYVGRVHDKEAASVGFE